jgi:hypothetical protein
LRRFSHCEGRIFSSYEAPPLAFAWACSFLPDRYHHRASAPAASEATPQKPNHKQKQDRANGSVDDRGDNAGTEMDADLRQQPVANKRADNAYYQIADESESGPPYDLSGQPASDETDEQYDQKTFIRQMHGGELQTRETPLAGC